MNKLAAIVLAAGKGKRMDSKHVNKVVLKLGGREMILYTIDLLENLKISFVIVVVGFAKKSVMDLLGQRVIFVNQKIRLGTAHAVKCALKYLPEKITDVLVLNGDDSAFYKEETIKSLIEKHREKDSSFTFLTINLDNPTGLGRVIRNGDGKVVKVVEERDATLEQKRIKEINPACYVFNAEFLREHLTKIRKSKITDEYYLTRLIDIAIASNEKIETVNAGYLSWRGINTVNELREAEKLFLSRHSGKRSQVPDGTWRSASRISSVSERFWTGQNDDFKRYE